MEVQADPPYSSAWKGKLDISSDPGFGSLYVDKHGNIELQIIPF